MKSTRTKNLTLICILSFFTDVTVNEHLLWILTRSAVSLLFPFATRLTKTLLRQLISWYCWCNGPLKQLQWVETWVFLDAARVHTFLLAVCLLV